ncbi:collagen alpha-2(I) chain-like [Poecile atricapillus]|uniref:collagen alpha-2(I) chain-like n=1 Tax=Poecile atricapillus TaxID=48891 RepID=UPI00273968F5|nr:collagen alpha-2(I) chain-like [Poecile atricapillus]
MPPATAAACGGGGEAVRGKAVSFGARGGTVPEPAGRGSLQAASLGARGGTRLSAGRVTRSPGRDSPRAGGTRLSPGRGKRVPLERRRACAPRSLTRGAADAAGAALRPQGAAGSTLRAPAGGTRGSPVPVAPSCEGKRRLVGLRPWRGRKGSPSRRRAEGLPGRTARAVVGGASLAASRSSQSLQPALGRARPSVRGGC